MMLAAIGCSKQTTPTDSADVVFTNAHVYTVNPAQPEAEFVAVSGNTIVFFGSAAEGQAYIGDDTDVVDAQGGMVLPGFVSAHDHIIASDWTKGGVNLNGATNKEETFALIREYALENPDLEVVVGQGYNPGIMGGNPTSAELDSLVPDRIAIILDFTIHHAWLNTKAMEAGGITMDSPDPVPGVTYWVRDEKGNPTGIGMELVWFPTYAKVAWDPERMITDSQTKLHAEATARGVTTALTPGVVTPNFSNTDGMFSDLEVTIELLQDLDARGDLNIRSFLQPAYKDPSSDPTEFARRARAMADKYSGDRVRVHGMKIHPEGTWSAKGVLMAEPWEGTDDYGTAATLPQRVKEVVLAANAKGLDVFTHVEGSGTVRGKIDAILAAREAGYDDERNALHHYMIVHPDDHQRTLEHNIPVNVTPIFSTVWSSQDKDYILLLGMQRAMAQVSHYADVANNGGKLSISADVPSSPIDNVGGLNQIYTAVTFKDPYNPDSAKFPPDGTTLTLAQAIEAVTINPAWQLRMEDKLGSLEVGKYADIVVLDRNLFDVESPEDILDVEVQGTMMDGIFRHRVGI